MYVFCQSCEKGVTYICFLAILGKGGDVCMFSVNPGKIRHKRVTLLGCCSS